MNAHTSKNQQKNEERRGRASRRKHQRMAFWAVIILAVGGGVWGVTQYGGTSGGSADGALSVPVSENDWVKGNPDAAITLIEYSDFQCPACQAYFPVLKRLTEEFSDDVRFVYRHFPLSNIHIFAELAARASEAAGAQGKFWEMHDILFERQPDWVGAQSPQSALISYAEELGLDVVQFETDLDSSEAQSKVRDHFQEGLRSDVNATPTFFLNGKKIQSPRTYDEFAELITATKGASQ